MKNRASARKWFRVVIVFYAATVDAAWVGSSMEVSGAGAGRGEEEDHDPLDGLGGGEVAESQQHRGEGGLAGPVGAPTSATRRPGWQVQADPVQGGRPVRYRTVASRSWMPNGPGGTARGRPGARAGSGASVTAVIRSAATRASWTAAAGSAVTASNAASRPRMPQQPGINRPHRRGEVSACRVVPRLRSVSNRSASLGTPAAPGVRMDRHDVAEHRVDDLPGAVKAAARARHRGWTVVSMRDDVEIGFDL